MKIGDVFFAIGIIIISSLLVFVVYDDIMNPYPVDIYGDREINVSDGSNISEKDASLVPASIINDTVKIRTSSKTNTVNTQNSNNAMLTQKSDSKPTSAQDSKSPNNNYKGDIKRYSGDYTPQGFSDMRNDKAVPQNKPLK